MGQNPRSAVLSFLEREACFFGKGQQKATKKAPKRSFGKIFVNLFKKIEKTLANFQKK